MAIDIVKKTTCNAPVDVAFTYVANYRNVPDWLFGISKFEPHGDLDYGPGAVFDASMHLGIRIHTRIRVDDWTDGSLISFDSIKGFKVQSTWSFAEVDGTTEITADVSYSLPFGPAGKAMGKVMEPFVKTAVKHSSHALAVEIEKQAVS